MKNIKSLAVGRDGRPWSATVYFDGKKVGDVIDHAMGGPLDINVKTPILNEIRTYALSEGAEESQYTDIMDYIFADIADDYDINQQMKKTCRTKIVLRFKEHADNEFVTIKTRYVPAKHKHRIVEQYKDRLVEIVNERFL